MQSLEQLIDFIDRPGIDKDLTNDIALLAPDLSLTDALRVQIGAKKRRVAAGDSIVGHQASFTSAAAQRMVPTMPVPMVGTLLGSLIRNDGDEVSLDAELTMIESEIGILMKRDLKGPYVNPMQALAAVEAFFPAIEVAPVRPGLLEGKWSNQHIIAVQKAAGGYVVLGSNLISPRRFEPRLEGVIVGVDGRHGASAVGIEAMGNPLVVLAAIANRLADVGEYLREGQVVITGSVPAPQRVMAGNRFAQVEFTRLGKVSVRFAA
ncbi:2-keto-4-pentenoate hydratase [Ferrovibrio sp.]|uniref:2-keto-4-pentenoate hydratase n=1 Tax=Ferrovibrio sp. TaxID=1917215 RepID=UPI0035B09F78